jgi:WD40 repeat protein
MAQCANPRCERYRDLLIATAIMLAVAVAVARDVVAQDASVQISFARQVRPILQQHCYGCHQPAAAKGGLDMTSRERMLRGGESEEPAVVPGRPDDGTLIAMITPAKNGRAEMPKDKPALAAKQIAILRAWIQQGAEIDATDQDIVTYSTDNPPTYTLPPVLTALDYSPDGTLLAVSGYHEVLLHKADGTGLEARLIGLSERIEAVKFSPDGRQLAVAGGLPGRLGEIQFWDVAKRKLIRSVPVTHDTVFGASWSRNGKLLAFGCTDATLRAIEAASGRQVFYQSAHSDWVLGTVFSLDASHLVSVSRDRSMKLNVVATQRFVDDITSITPGALKGGLRAVDRHPDRDQLLVGGADGVPRIYRMHREKERKIGDDFNLIRAFPRLPGRIFAVAYSPDAARVVAGSSHDGGGEVRVFQESDAKQLAVMEGITGGIYTTVFHPDGDAIASGGFAGKIYLHDAATGRLVNSFVPVPLE